MREREKKVKSNFRALINERLVAPISCLGTRQQNEIWIKSSISILLIISSKNGRIKMSIVDNVISISQNVISHVQSTLNSYADNGFISKRKCHVEFIPFKMVIPG